MWCLDRAYRPVYIHAYINRTVSFRLLASANQPTPLVYHHIKLRPFVNAYNAMRDGSVHPRIAETLRRICPTAMDRRTSCVCVYKLDGRDEPQTLFTFWDVSTVQATSRRCALVSLLEQTSPIVRELVTADVQMPLLPSGRWCTRLFDMPFFVEHVLGQGACACAHMRAYVCLANSALFDAARRT